MEKVFEPDWGAVFQRDFCKICKNRADCPYDWKCKDMKDFIDLNEEEHVRDGNSTEKIRP